MRTDKLLTILCTRTPPTKKKKKKKVKEEHPLESYDWKATTELLVKEI
jgi:hypothetical protein